MRKAILYFILISSLLIFSLSEASDCSSRCRSNSSPFPNKKVINLKKFTGMEEDPNIVFIDPKTSKIPKTDIPYAETNTTVNFSEKNYGKLYRFRNRTTIWLQNTQKCYIYYIKFRSSCPPQYNPASMAQYRELIEDNSISTLGLIDGETYLSSEKIKPWDQRSFIFKGIKVNGKNAVETTKFMLFTKEKVICVKSEEIKTDKFFYKSPEDIVINSINYGRIIKIGKYSWLQKDVKTHRIATGLSNNCPLGFRIPNVAELEDLIINTDFPQYGNNALILDPEMVYMSSTVSFPNKKFGWKFKGVDFSINPKIIYNIHTYFNRAKLRVKCILDMSPLKSNIHPIIQGLDKDLYYMDSYKLKIILPNVIAAYWSFENGTNSEGLQVDFKANAIYCSNIRLNLQLFEGTILESCSQIWTIPKKRNNKSPSFNNSGIKSTSSLASNVQKTLGLHFTQATAPLSPIPDGGSYILYGDKSSNNLKVVKLEADMITSTTVDTGESGYPFDIVTTPAGFAILYKELNDSNHLVLKGMYSNGTQIFKRSIMNNGNNRHVAKDQLNFNPKPVGMNVMFKPDNGKLVFARGRIFAIFAHYNNFNRRGGEEFHTGDSLISIDDMTGRDEKVVSPWGTSHSLRQRLIYNGKRIISTSLGDAGPMNILISSADVFKLKGLRTFKSVLDGYIVGNKLGKAAGRIGGLFEVSDNLYVSGFARRPAIYNNIKNDKDEMGLMYYHENLSTVKKIVLGKGNNVNLLKGAMYGSNIIIAYGTTKYNEGDIFLRGSVANDDKMFMMMTDSQGKVITSPFEVNHFSLLAGDDFDTLSDGRVVWTYVETNGDLKVYYLPAP